MTGDSRSPWYCPDCELWIGYKLETCSEGHSPPRIPVRHDDVDVDDSRLVTRWDRFRIKMSKTLRWSA